MKELIAKAWAWTKEKGWHEIEGSTFFAIKDRPWYVPIPVWNWMVRKVCSFEVSFKAEKDMMYDEASATLVFRGSL